ncbi:Fe-S oxidoreductase, partial [Litorilinea aerophila]
PQVIRKLKAARVESVALSLDASTAERHDAFRGVAGSFRWTLAGARAVVEAGIPLQINTMVTAQTLDDIPRIHELLQDVGITRWALFFLIATGRGAGLAEVTPAEGERLLVWLSQLARDPQTKFVIKTTEAHHYRRIVVQQMARRLPPEAILASPAGRAFGIRDGNG